MKEPKRLFESGSPFERSILGFGRDEAPSDDLARKTLSAMAAVRVANAAPSPAAFRWPRPRSILVGAAAIGLGVFVASLAIERGEVAPVATPAARNVPAEHAEPPAVSNADERSEPVVTPDSLPNVPPRTVVTVQTPSGARAAAPTEPAPVASASIAREVELLDAVKAKLGAGDAVAATRSLDAYDAEFPRGTLRPEATVLRIRALLLRGDRAGAEKLGAEFLAMHPAGVHAKRVRALLADTAGGSGASEK